MSYTDIKALILNITNIDLDWKIFNEKNLIFLHYFLFDVQIFDVK